MTGQVMRTLEMWWVGSIPPNDYQPCVKVNEYMTKLLKYIENVQKGVASQLKQKIQGMNRRLGETLKITEWKTGEKLMYWFFSDCGHALSPHWVGPVVVTNEASPTVHKVELKDAKGKRQRKWFHSTQLKKWKGE